jgi:ribosomal protein L11 methyltransferase
MGCGTGILGILASMRGATKVTGIDIDSWCTQNSLENCTLNNIHNFEILQGDAQLLVHSEPFDIILANINRNILLEDLPAYCRVLKPGGTIILSGFYHNDLEAIGKKAQEENLIIKNTKENNHWVAVSYESSMNK